MTSKGRILIVDDIATNVDILRRILRKDYDLEAAANGEEGLDKLPAFRPQLVLLDIMMPGIDGYEVCRRIKSGDQGSSIQVLLVSGKGSAEERLEGYRAGADDYIVKPFNHDELLSKVKVHFRLGDTQRQLHAAKEQLQIYANDLEQLVEQRTRQWAATQDMTVFALARLTDSRDTETGEHVLRMRYYAQTLAVELSRRGPYRSLVDEPFLRDLYRASPLHDIGKVAIPDAILQKPGQLTAEEFEIMKRHVTSGAATLCQARDYVGRGSFMDMAAEIARYHHEKFDGSGYCEGLAGDAIPLSARIVALADVYDALTSRRVYKPAMPPADAYRLILAESGRHFDPAIVDAFEGCFDDFGPRGDLEAPWLQSLPHPSAAGCLPFTELADDTPKLNQLMAAGCP